MSYKSDSLDMVRRLYPDEGIPHVLNNTDYKRYLHRLKKAYIPAENCILRTSVGMDFRGKAYDV